ncbi:MAG: hypothetical protein RLZZ126_1135 [Pseudomonadota bacterium]|jgi:sirohydrochlorin cobaltochelatase
MTVIVLLAHGSRDPLWKQPVEAVAAALAQHRPDAVAGCAYIEHSSPSFEEFSDIQCANGATEFIVFPLFIGAGRHVREDVQALVQAARAKHPGARFEVRPFLGDEPSFTAMAVRWAAGTPAEPGAV